MYSRIYIFLSLILLFMIQTLYGDDFYLLSTGRKADAVDQDRYGRTWMSPKEIKLWGKYISFAKAGNTYNMTENTPFYTAAISDTLFSFRFPIKEPGRKYVRLYFYATSYYRHYHISDANFSVIANSKVLTDFPNRRVFNSDLPTCAVLEFSIPVLADHLTLLLAPSYERPVEFAFINGIEIVSHPDIYSGTASLVGKVKGRRFIIHTKTSLETIARLNVGGEPISILDDSRQQFRSWDTDEQFLGSEYPGVREDATKYNIIVMYPPDIFADYVAPLLMYQTARSMGLGPDYGDNRDSKMTWRIPVDSKYYYLVRLHFCEVTSNIKVVNDRVFNIYINGYLAESGADVIAWTEQIGVTVFKDYVVYVPDLWRPEVRIVLAPDVSSHTKYYDTLLNGIEIFKISDCNGYLDENHDPTPAFGVQKPLKKC